ncbi:hypothetical protein ACOMHN_052710 [Nucella lapillus]
MFLSLMESGSSRLGVTLDPLLPHPHFPHISLLHYHTPITWFKLPLTPDSQFHITALLVISKSRDFIQRQTSNPMNFAAGGFNLPPQHYNPDSQSWRPPNSASQCAQQLMALASQLTAPRDQRQPAIW